MTHALAALAVLIVAASAAPAAAQAVRSIYTEASADTCRETRVSAPDEGAFADYRCPGVLGWGVILHEDDSRANITLVAPSRRRHDLNLWQVVGNGFSSIGPRAEWRVRGRSGAPHAFIVRYAVTEGGDGQEPVSYLAVARLLADGACVTDRVAPGRRQNETARALADQRGRACLRVPS